jgi:hypothetical protein
MSSTCPVAYHYLVSGQCKTLWAQIRDPSAFNEIDNRDGGADVKSARPAP